jgi:metal-responsive CopG/Arc/MetJ family transcriptional regulator
VKLTVSRDLLARVDRSAANAFEARPVAMRRLMDDALKHDAPRKVGRPATGVLPTVKLSVPGDLLARVDQSATDAFEARPVAMRRLLDDALKREEGPPRE